MEFESINKEIRIEASPEVVYEVISQPEHVQQWWADEVQFGSEGEAGFVAFGDRSEPDAKVVALTVMEADPPRRFAFRWVHEADESPTAANSLLVTFELIADNGGTLLRFTESGFRDMGLQGAELETQYSNHARGWNRFVPQLGEYAAGLVAAR